MSSSAWLAYLAAISALIISPGPSALLVVRTASSLGVVAAVRVILGGSLSALILICVSLAGLHAWPVTICWACYAFAAACIFSMQVSLNGARQRHYRHKAPSLPARGYSCRPFSSG